MRGLFKEPSKNHNLDNLGYNGDSGKENGNYRDYRVYIGVILPEKIRAGLAARADSPAVWERLRLRRQRRGVDEPRELRNRV